jgi:hypothetical protein
MINAYKRQRMVDRMKLSALRLEHHLLDNKCLAKFKECITENRMTHKFVPPDCHRCCNITEWAIQKFKNHFVSILTELMIGFPSPYGAISCEQQNLPSIYYNRAMLHQKCPCMPMSMGINIATPYVNVYCKIRQCMYGLPQAEIIAQEFLTNRLKEHDYNQSKTTPGLRTHEWCPITFSLVIDDFGVKNIGDEHTQHLIQTT